MLGNVFSERDVVDGGQNRSKTEEDKQRKGKQALEGPSTHVDVGVDSPMPSRFYGDQGRNKSHEKGKRQSDSEESLYDKYGSHRGYSVKRSQRPRSNSPNRRYSISPRVSSATVSVRPIPEMLYWLDMTFDQTECSSRQW